LTRDAERQAAKRLASAVTQFAASATTSLAERRRLLREIAASEAIVRLVATGREEWRPEALARLGALRAGASSATSPPTEVWRADGTRLAFIGRDLGAGDSTSRVPVRRPGLETLATSDSVTFGQIHVDGTEAFFWAIAPVRR